MYCYRRLLQINWTQKVTNREIRKRLNITKDLMQALMRMKLGLFGHVCRMKNSRKIKNVMPGMMEGTGRRGRPCREWMDDITDWTRIRALCPWVMIMIMMMMPDMPEMIHNTYIDF